MVRSVVTPRRWAGAVGVRAAGGIGVRAAGGIGEGGERLQVAQRLPALDPPVPLAADRGAEADLQHGVEVVVGVAEHRAEDAVELLGGHRGVRQPAGQVDVADVVDGVRDAVHAGVVLQQEGPQLLAVLVGLAADERLHPQRVLADAEPAHRLELLGAGQVDQPDARAGVLVDQLGLAQRLVDDGVELLRPVRAVVIAPPGRRAAPAAGRAGARARGGPGRSAMSRAAEA